MISWIKERRRSLFVQIFVSFLALILLFGGVYTAIYHMFKGTLQEEIIQSNQSDLHDAAGRFTNQLQRLQVLLYDLYSQEDLIGFNSQLHSAESQNVDYLKARSVILQMRRDVYNPLFTWKTLLFILTKKILPSANPEAAALPTCSAICMPAPRTRSRSGRPPPSRLILRRSGYCRRRRFTSMSRCRMPSSCCLTCTSRLADDIR